MEKEQSIAKTVIIATLVTIVVTVIATLFTHTASANEQYKLETIPYTVFLEWTNTNRADNNLVALSFETQDFYSNVETAVIIEDAREDKSFSLVSDGVNIKMYRL